MRSFAFLSILFAVLAEIAQAQPANDSFANAWPLSGTVVLTNGSSALPANATKEPGEPNHAGFVGGRSVWFSWTAPLEGATRISTAGSQFNTLLGVYTGNAVNGLSLVASNDNFSAQGNTSRVEFNAQPGTTYRIAIDGRNNSGTGTASGGYVLALQMLGSIALTSPANGSFIASSTPITLAATASTPNPPIARVDFIRGGSIFATEAVEPFTAVFNDAPLGTNTFIAVMTDSFGQSTTSEVVNVVVLNPGVTIVSPLDGAVFFNANPIVVSAIGFLPSGSATNVEFFVNEQRFGASASVPFGAVWSNVTAGVHRFTAVGLDDLGLSHTSAPVLVAVARTLLPTNSVWKYLDNGSDQGTGWIAPNFDDSGWASGPAQLGYGDGDEATVVRYGLDPANKFTTTYFRHAFPVANAAGYTNLLLRVQRDDGAVIYLNGLEAARLNMPTGLVTYATFAASTTSDDGVGFVSANAPADLLLEDMNVLAVEIHQSDLTSSDISFNLELLGVPAIIRNQVPLVRFVNPTNGQYFLGATSLPIEAEVTDPDGSVARVEFFADGLKLGEVTNNPFAFVWNYPSPGAHSLRIVATDNEGASGAASVSVFIYDAAGIPLVQLTRPLDNAVFQGPANLTLVANAIAPNVVTNVLFFANGAAIGEDNAAPFSIVWSNASFGSSQLSAVAFDANGLSATSSVVRVSINPPADNTEAPRVFGIIPEAGETVTNLTSIQVSFTERVVGVDATDLLVNGVPASGASGSGSNYNFSFPQPAYGNVAITWATTHDIIDVGFPPLSFDASGPGSTWNYTLLDTLSPTVAAKNPPANATVTNLTQVTVSFSEGVAGVNAGDLLVNGVPAGGLSSSANTSYTFSFTQPYSGPVNISWAGAHGIADLAVMPNSFDAAGPGATWSYTLDARTILVQSNASWRFLKGTAEASTPMDAWRAPGFDDLGWSNALAPFYYGDPYNSPANPGTLLSDMQNNYTSIYLRHRFNVPNLSAVTNLFLNAQSDDGFIAWINGVEIYRYNMPTGAVPFNAVTLTSITEPNGRGAAYLSYTLPDPTNYLVEGENVLAVHGFNQSLTASSDFGFNAQLYTYLADASVAAPRVLAAVPTPGEIFYLTNVTVTFTEPVAGVDAGDLLVNGVPAAEVTAASNTTYTFGFARPAFGEVIISWAAENGIVDLDAPAKPFDGNSPSSMLRYTLLNPSKATVASQSPLAGATLTNLTEITVTFSEGVTGVDAGDLLVNGLPALNVHSETNPTYTFGFAQPPFGPVFITWVTNHGIVDLEVPPNDFDPTRPGGVWTYALIDPMPFVELLNPTNGAVFQTPVNVVLSAAAGDLDGVITHVEFFEGANKIGEDTNAPFAFTWRNPSAGLYTLLAVATDNSGRTATSAPVNVTVNPGPTGLVLSGAIWKYLDNGTDQSNAWREVSFDDSTWLSGPSELGYGDTTDGRPEATIVSFGTNTNNKIITTYFRHAFTVDDLSAVTNLLLRLVRDDGAAVYLNGVEVFRDNLPSGDLTYLTLATTNVLGPDEARFFQAPVSPAALVAGTNYLAVEVHQNLPTSADISFDLELIANIPPAPPTVALISPANNSVIQTPANVTLLANAADSDGSIARIEFFEGINKLGEATNAPYAFTWISPSAGSYTLLAVATDSSGLQATSAPVNLTVLAGPTALVLTGSVWKYLDNGSDQSNAWREVSFDDSTWASGPAQLGYGDGDEATVVGFGPDPQNKFITTYFRRTFTVSDPSAFLSLTLDLLRDDGAVVYLNGVEVYRNNMPSGPVDFHTLAFNGSADEANYFRTLLSPAVLVSGLNVVAVEMHQADPTSSDISFDLQLAGATTSLPLALIRGPYLQSGTPTGGVVRWRTDVPSDGVVFYGTNPANLASVAIEAAVTNEHIVTLTGLQPDTKYYYSIGSSTRTLANGPDYWFITSPLPGAQKPTRFWVLGDSGTANNNARNVRDAYYNFAAATRPADLWLMLGDNAYQSGTDSEHQAAVFDMYPTTLRNLFLWPTIGNHETSQSFTATDFPYLHIFSLPRNGEAGGVPSGTEKYYSFDYANVHLICLDSMTSTRSSTSPMAQWLQDDLAATTADWVIVFFHHPPYTKGNHNSDAETELIEIRQNILPILEANGVDLVLCGHSHAWERSFLLHGHYGNSPTLEESMKLDGGDGREDGTGAYRKNEQGEGVVYTVAGNGGQITGGSLDHPAHFLSLNELGSMIIDVSSNRLDAMFLATNGVFRDRFTLLKVQPGERLAAPANLVAFPASATGINLFWTDLATNEMGFIVQRSTDGTNFTTQLAVGLNSYSAVDSGLLDGVTYYYRIAATNASGMSDFSNIASVTAGAPKGTPQAPGELVASSDNGIEVYRSHVILRWRDHATNESGFQIERSLDGAVFLVVGTVGANVTHYVDHGLESSTAYYYRVRSFNLLGTSLPSNLAGDITHPQSDIALAGESVTFHAGAEGQPPMHYQWRFVGAAIFGETNESLTLASVQASDEGPYSVVVTDTTGRIVSNPAYLFVLVPPQIVVQPLGSTNTVGTPVSFSVVADGIAPFGYRWMKDGVLLDVPDDSTLAIGNVQMIHQGGYEVIVGNEFGSVTSRVARLTVNLPPIAVADTVYRFPDDESLAVEIAGLLANDGDPDGDSIRFFGVETNSARGAIVGTGGRYVLYRPSEGFKGADSFTYTIVDARGGFAAGLVSIEMSDNTPPAMALIPDYFASVLSRLSVTNLASDADVPTNTLRYSLEAGAPLNARINPNTGVFRWVPSREQAPGTNVITMTVSDNGIPSLSDRKSFTVIVDDYVEIKPGTAVVRAGEQGSIPLAFFSSAALVSLNCALQLPSDRLTNLTVEALAPDSASISLQITNSDRAILTFNAQPGQTLQGAQELVRLHFTAVPGQTSAFIPVEVHDMNCLRATAGRNPTVLANFGRVAIVGSRSMLEGRFAANGSRELILYGNAGINYHVDASTNAADPSTWTSWQQITLTNLFGLLPIESNAAPAIFYRARE